MKTKYLSIALASLALYSCNGSGGSNDWTDSTAAGSGKTDTYMNAEERIAALKTTDWKDSTDYHYIHQWSIENTKSTNELDRMSLTESLNQNYADQLVRTCSHILDSDCAPRHATLRAAYKEYGSRSFGAYLPDGADDMKEAYKRHEEQLQYSVSSSYNVPLKTFLDTYDASYESKKRAEAKAIRATSPTCTEILTNTSDTHLDQVFAQRKQNYYAALANKFCKDPNPSRGDYNRLVYKLESAKDSKALISKVDRHWDAIYAAQATE